MNHYPIRSIRTRDWKLILNLTPEAKYAIHIDLAPRETKPGNWGAAASDPTAAAKVNRYHHRPAVELYDLVKDPHELHNFAQDPAHTNRVREMQEELEAWGRVQGEQP